MGLITGIISGFFFVCLKLKQKNMPVPDKTIFGLHLEDDSGIYFGEVRQIVDMDTKLKILKSS